MMHMKARVGVAATERFHDLVKQGTPPSIFKGSSNGAEAVASHFILSDLHSSQSNQDSVVAHRPSATAGAREYIRSLSCEVVQGPEDRKGLPRQWNDVINLCLRDSITPLCIVQVDVSPDRGAKLARAHEEQGSQSAELKTRSEFLRRYRLREGWLRIALVPLWPRNVP